MNVASPGEEERRWRHGGTLLAARFPDVSSARLAIEAVQSTGIDGDDVRWLSPFPDESRRSSATPDRRITRYLARRIVVGALVGAAGGALVGLIAGAILVAVTRPAEALGEVVALVAVGIVLGIHVGAYVGFERAGTLSDAWNTTFDELETGATWIGVRTTHPADRERARRALERHQPITIREF
jgi:hypothetical protein